MDVLTLDNKIIITNRKSNLIKLRNEFPFLNFKILSEHELIENFFFTFDDRARIFLMRQGIRLENTDEILNSLYFLKPHISKKIDNLISIKNSLEKENLLIKNNFYKDFLKQKEVIIYQQSYTKELKLIFSSLNVYPRVINDYQQVNHPFYKFKNTNDEIRYLFEQINLLIDKNIPFKNIKIVTNNDVYLFLLKKYQTFYSFKFNFPSQESLTNSEDYLLFKSILSSTVIDETLTQMKDRFYDEQLFSHLINRLLKVREYIKEDEIETYLSYLASQIKISEKQYENGIDIYSSLDQCSEDDYVFLLGFTLNNYPTIFKDDDYLSDEEKNLLGISTSFDKQKIQEINITNNLCRLKNLYLSFSEFDGKETYYPSLIAERIGIQVQKYEFSNIIYSKEHFLFIMGKIFDDHNNYSIYSPFYFSIDEEDTEYLTYDNKFNNLASYQPESLKLSFTSLNTYFECAFKYYLTYILKINTFEDSINIKIGNILHKLLEFQVKGKPLSLEQAIEENELSADERVLIESLIPQIKKVLSDSVSFQENTHLNNMVAEENRFAYHINSRSSLEGKIDLLISDQNHYAIIDYKTSDYHFEPDKIEYGFSLQLPLYYLLTKNSIAFENKELLGLYIKTLISIKFYKEDFKYLLLNGLTLSEEGFSLVQGDKNFIKPSYGKYTPYNQNDFLALIETTKKLISKASEDILNGVFTINPKIFFNENLSCKNCNFKNVCYHTYDDNEYL